MLPIDAIREAFATEQRSQAVDDWVRQAIARAPGEAFERLLADITARKPLSPRERQVLALAAEGFTADDTATELGIAYETVREYRERLMRKLGARSMTHAVGIWGAHAHAEDPQVR